VDIGYIKATGNSVKIYLPKTAKLPEIEFEWKIPKWSNAIERDRARTYFQAYAAAAALHFAEKAMEDLHKGNTRTWTDFRVPEEAIGCGFHEAVRGVLSHHVVIRDGKIANYHPYPPTPWNASPRDSYGTPGPYEDAVQNTPIFEENGPDKFKGIDIMSCTPTAATSNCSVCETAWFVCGWKGAATAVRRRHKPCGRRSSPQSSRWRPTPPKSTSKG
jgi:hydrogenase large subunit